MKIKDIILKLIYFRREKCLQCGHFLNDDDLLQKFCSSCGWTWVKNEAKIKLQEGPSLETKLEKPQEPVEIKTRELPPAKKEEDRREKHIIVVGIDFGTSGSKIVIRDNTFMLDNPATSKNLWVLYPASSTKGFPRFVFPSIVGLDNGKIYFGSDAIEKCRIKISSLKMCVCCSRKENCSSCDYGRHYLKKKGSVFFEDTEMEVDELATFLLAFFITEAKKKTTEIYKGKNVNLDDLFYNLGAPLIALDNESTKIVLEKIFYKALLLAQEVSITNGCSIKELHKLYAGVANKNLPLPDLKSRNFSVLPEGSAGTVAYFTSSCARDGIYFIVDVGAWTTDMSCFRFNVPGNLSSFYSTESFPLGGDSIDKCYLQKKQDFSPDYEDAIYKMRIARQENRLDASIVNSCALDIGKKIRKGYLKTLGVGFKRENNQRAWENITLFLTGGGINIENIKVPLLWPLNLDFNGFEIVTIGTVVAYTNVTHQKIRIFASTIEDEDYLAVASGLSIHVPNWPQFDPPSRVENVERIAPA